MTIGGKPTLGYPTRGEAIFALCADGVTLTEAAKRIGITRDNARSLLRYQRIRRGLCGYVSEGLVRAAYRRGITVDELVARLLATIARDNLADAILDDMGHAEAAE